jgi:hypothetical protein
MGITASSQNLLMIGGLLGLGGYTIKQIIDKSNDKKWVKAHPDASGMIKQLEDSLAPFGFKFPHKLARKDKAAKKQIENEGGPSKPGKDTPAFDTQLATGDSGLVQ